MKAISLWQPWASLMAIGAKTIETRSWPTNYRGPLAIHASKKLIFPDDTEFRKAMTSFGLSVSPDQYPLGAILGVCELGMCVQMVGSTRLEIPLPERLFGDYRPGRFMWMTRNFKRFDKPIPARGYQGLWEWEPPV